MVVFVSLNICYCKQLTHHGPGSANSANEMICEHVIIRPNKSHINNGSNNRNKYAHIAHSEALNGRAVARIKESGYTELIFGILPLRPVPQRRERIKS